MTLPNNFEKIKSKEGLLTLSIIDHFNFTLAIIVLILLGLIYFLVMDYKKINNKTMPFFISIVLSLVIVQNAIYKIDIKEIKLDHFYIEVDSIGFLLNKKNITSLNRIRINCDRHETYQDCFEKIKHKFQ